MLYKDGVDQLQQELAIAKISGGKVIPDLNPLELFIQITKTAAKIQTEWMPLTAQKYVNWAAGTSQYNLAADKNAILRIKSIKPALYVGKPDYEGLDKVSADEMSSLYKSGMPTSYALVGNASDTYTVEFDFSPENSYDAVNYPNNRFLITYHPRLRTFDSQAVSNYAEFSDYNINNDGWGGSYKLPSVWDELIVEGAAAKILNDKTALELWEMNCERKSRNAESYVNLNLSGYLGFEEDIN